MRSYLLRSAACAAVVLALSAQSRAALLYDIAATQPGTAFTVGGDWGVQFNVTTPIAVNSLGLWDEGSNGLASSHPVGLWADTGATGLLASTTITNSSTVVPSTAGVGRWLFNDLASPVTLPAGTYTLGFFQGVTGDPFRGQASAFFISGTSYGSLEADANNPNFAEPTVSGTSNAQGYFGPNLSTTALTPEPASLGLIGLGIAMTLRRRKPARE